MFYRFAYRTVIPHVTNTLGRVEGLEHIPEHGSFLIAANHIDFLDGFFITAAISKRRTTVIQFLSVTNNYWWTGGATITIPKKEKAQSLDRALHALEQGVIVAIFPEGHRNATGVLDHGKTGIARLALWSGVPVLPIGLVGPSGNSMWQSVQQTFFQKKRTTIQIGPPLYFRKNGNRQLSEQELGATTATIMTAIARLCQKTYAS